MEKATFKDLIARKMQKEDDKHKFKEIEVKSIGKSLVFKKPSDDAMLDVMDEIEKDSSTRGIASAYKKLIYKSCETLQSTELQNELGIIDPFDTVGAIFDLSDVLMIGEELCEFSGIAQIGEEIKNS